MLSRMGPEATLREFGWTFVGPSGHTDTEIGRYWVNPASGMKYTRSGATALLELREGKGNDGSIGNLQRIHLEKQKAKTTER